MSMINDALRRASDAAKNSPEPPPLPVTPVAESAPPPMMAPPAEEGLSLRPLETQPRSKLPYILAILLFCCMAGAAVVYVWEKQKKAPRVQPVKPVVASAAVKSPDPVSAEVRVATASQPASARTPAQTTTATTVAAKPIPSAAPAVAATATPINTAPVRFPQLRLQSIFYRPSNPSVMINGRTLFMDDEIQGVKVAAIEPSSVTLVLSGQTNVLTLR
jgi:hypothetical protein